MRWSRPACCKLAQWIRNISCRSAPQSGQQVIADELFRLALPDAWLVSGCLVQSAWNVLTGACDYGINDYDIFYFDPTRRGRPRMP